MRLGALLRHLGVEDPGTDTEPLDGEGILSDLMVAHEEDQEEIAALERGSRKDPPIRSLDM